jgi:hypothetical protein
MDSLASRDPQRAAEGEAMNRLDEIEEAIARAGWATDDTIYFSTETRDDILALVAVARAVRKRRRIEFEMAKVVGEEWDALDAQLFIARNEEGEALAPLLAEREG